jgi:hypothetical protein
MEEIKMRRIMQIFEQNKIENIPQEISKQSVTDFCRGLLKLNFFAFAYDQPEGKNKYRFNHITKTY